MRRIRRFAIATLVALLLAVGTAYLANNNVASSGAGEGNGQVTVNTVGTHVNAVFHTFQVK